MGMGVQNQKKKKKRKMKTVGETGEEKYIKTSKKQPIKNSKKRKEKEKRTLKRHQNDEGIKQLIPYNRERVNAVGIVYVGDWRLARGGYGAGYTAVASLVTGWVEWSAPGRNGEGTGGGV